MNRAERRRQEKANNQKPVYYQYTPQQIQAIRKQAVEDRKAELDVYVSKIVQEEWDKRKEALSGETDEESMLKVLCLLMAVPTKILCEQFKWKPVDESSDNRLKLKKFSELVVNEVNRVCSDDTMDIRTYGDEVFEKYGVKYEVQ